MSSETPREANGNATVADPTAPTEPRKRKKRRKLTAEERRAQAEERRKRLLARGDAGTRYIQKQVTKEEMLQKQQENLKKNLDDILDETDKKSAAAEPDPLASTSKIFDSLNRVMDPCATLGDDVSDDSIPRHTNGPLSDPFTEILRQTMTSGAAGQNGEDPMSGMFRMFTNFGNIGAMGSAGQTAENAEERKENEYYRWLEMILHRGFVFLFVALLVMCPSIDVLGYNIHSDALVFFLTCEIGLISVFYGRKYYQNYVVNKQPQSAFGVPFLDQLLGNGMIGKLMNRLKILQDIFMILKQLGTDFCLTIFLWVLLAALQSNIMMFTSSTADFES